MKKKKKKYTFLLDSCPQKKAICTRVYRMSPKKPNSANRTVCMVDIISTKASTFAHLPGEDSSIHELTTVLLRGGRLRDVPRVNFKMIRGKYDLSGVVNRKNARSKYGTKRWKKF